MLNQALRQIGRVQKIDSAVLELERRFAAIDPGRRVEAEAQKAREAKEAAEERFKEMRAAAEDLELKSKGIDQKIESERKRLYAGGIYNAKEAEAIDREIANLRERRSGMDDRLLELWEEIPKAEAEFQETDREFREAEGKAKEYAERYDSLGREYNEKRARLLQMREEEAAKGSPELLEKYDAMRKKRGGVGLAAVVEDQCSACGTAVPKKQLGSLKAGDTLETCENCLRFIYLEEEA